MATNAEKIETCDVGSNAVALSERSASGDGAAVAVAQPVGEMAALFSMIERAARDPNVDIAKMERLFDMQQQAAAKRARMEYDAAFSLMQPKLPEIDKRGKIIIKSKDGDKILQSTPYALWDDTNKVIKPILAEFGFGLSFRITQTPDRLTTTAVLSHVGGHREETSFSAPIDNTGSKNNVQGWGSSFTYGKRYSGTALLNITTRGEDDDGKAAGGGVISAPVTDQDIADFRKALADKNVPEGAVCEMFSVETLEDLTRKQFDDAVKRLAKTKARAK